MRKYMEINEELNEFIENANVELDKFLEENELNKNNMYFTFNKHGAYLMFHGSYLNHELLEKIESSFGKVLEISHDLNTFKLKLEM